MLQDEQSDFASLENRVGWLEHFVETLLPLALLRASDKLDEKLKIPSQRILRALEDELTILKKERDSGTSADVSISTD